MTRQSRARHSADPVKAGRGTSHCIQPTPARGRAALALVAVVGKPPVRLLVLNDGVLDEIFG
jgi:hypothetical protein